MNTIDPILNLLPDKLRQLADWQSRWHDYQSDETLAVPEAKANAVLAVLLDRLQDNYPFWHPSYAGQMLKPPHAIASMAYFLAQQINPNNHALDGGPATAKLETEVVAELARMFGYENYLGHLTSSGTVANLEALWVARSLHPQKAIAFSAEAHYTHSRMCEVIGAKTVEIAADNRGRMDLDDLRAKLQTGEIGTVVLTSGTTALGAVDLIHQALELRHEFDFRIHVDGAYGGFFKLLAEDNDLDAEAAAAFRAIPEADSIVVDPHKHGLQPYGCGSVLFRDPAVGRFYKHDSPYTYFTSNELHLGEISLECSRAGAAAAALWATLQCFPLESDKGLGAVLRKTRAAALAWAELIDESDKLRLLLPPQLDIINFYAVTAGLKISDISQLTHRVFETLMHDAEHPIYLAKFNAKPNLFAGHQDLDWDAPVATVFRSVLMKPEQLAYVPTLHKQVLSKL
ncbi:MAG TPA: aminotransferase class V-fold PLP-dependent enzyme [Blastocatellia bacterium]|nr:aminotransferase class V-fold PLP-dependent enzyme [Blastocatellia bacterium]HMV86794.1 aminotransferase class V-fold PLP-dependent enzyme [Blastocatellia bacterium]HMX27576.1 aminotransferase class V-fold PLP-dependent enzyme [Blastocatellia bacterium]HNG33860.1 aminotransferase class V-fold PLP-dependent enzyme [Blastocatellia bacterium]